jgi:hypothetical protein
VAEKNPILTTYDRNNAQLETSGPQAFTLRTTAGPMTTNIANLGSNVVGEYTDIEVSFTVTNEVAKFGYFEFGMQKWNSGTQSLRQVASAI